MVRLNRSQHLLDIIRAERQLRRELREGLEAVIGKNKHEIGHFADHNIDMPPLPTGISGLSRLTLNEDLIRFYLAATYFANARYFERRVDLESERISFSFADGASHAENGLYWHGITIPLQNFLLAYSLFYAMDAETRHAIHQNILQDKGSFRQDRANRAYLVITEAIDDGAPIRVIPETTPQFDPFFNDFFMLSDINGHNGAQYLTRHLSNNPRARWMQLYWLSRLLIRTDPEPSAEFEELQSMFGEFSPSLRESPFDRDIRMLANFYRGRNGHSDTLSERLMEVRVFAFENFPYFPPENDFVLIGGRRFRIFASQLDYTVLKLATTKPKQLYSEAV